MPEDEYRGYEGLRPFLDITREGMGDLVDGLNWFDTIADNVVFEYLYAFPGYPRSVQGRAAVMQLYAGYSDNIRLHGADHLAVHHGNGDKTIVLEYAVHGTVLRTGAAYDNRFCSVVMIENRKIVRWRDYMDSLAAWNALTA